MTKILVVLGNSYAFAVEGLGEIKTNPKDFFKHPEDYSLILFTGGEDITPEWYGHTSPTRMCYNNEERDLFEKDIFNHAVKHGVRMTGICRGIQFINVMAGGTMYHHVDNHSGTKHIMELPNGDSIKINSLHHQMVIPPKDGLVAGWAGNRLSIDYYGDKDLIVGKPTVEPESLILPSIQAAGVQYHPEMMSPLTNGWIYYHNMAKALIEKENFSDVISMFMGESCTFHQLMQSEQ